jgi:hypothetical protein
MFKFIRNWLRRRDYARGRAWAAEELDGGTPERQVEAYLITAIMFGDFDDFDRGVREELLERRRAERGGPPCLS